MQSIEKKESLKEDKNTEKFGWKLVSRKNCKKEVTPLDHRDEPHLHNVHFQGMKSVFSTYPPKNKILYYLDFLDDWK